MRSTIEGFLNCLSVEKGVSPNTVAGYRNDLTQFAAFVEAQLAERDLAAGDWTLIDRDMLLGYNLRLREREYAPATVARKMATIKSFFGFLVRENIVARDPAENLGRPRLAKPLPRTISISQVEELLSQPAQHATPEAKRDKAMLELLYATGMRVTELVSLNVNHLNLDDGFVRCFGKGSKERMIPIHDQAIRDLMTYIREARPLMVTDHEEALFLNRQGQRLTRQGFWFILKNYARALGIEDQISPHIIRHSIATHLLHSGKMNLRELQEFLGHASISSTQIYTHLTSEHVRRVYESSHPRAR